LFFFLPLHPAAAAAAVVKLKIIKIWPAAVSINSRLRSYICWMDEYIFRLDWKTLSSRSSKHLFFFLLRHAAAAAVVVKLKIIKIIWPAVS